jgi:hypothetical protein
VSRRGLSVGRRTQLLGPLAVAGVGAAVAVEWARVWRHGSAPLPAEGHHLIEAGRTAAEETIAVFREGYRASPVRENALLNLLVSFTATFGLARAVTALIRSGRGPLGNIRIADRHIHHYVPGIGLALAAGGTSIAVGRETLDPWLAIPFGGGAALILDEAALLLEMEDVYWSEEGVLSLQFSFAAIALLAALALGVRLARRGESTVLPPPSQPVTPWGDEGRE